MSLGARPSPLLIRMGDPSASLLAATGLRSGMVVAIPTDTVYGLAAALTRPDAIARLYALKQRPAEKAIPVLLADRRRLDMVAADLGPIAEALIERFWPGALTVVVPALAGLPEAVTSTTDDGVRTVALRVPAHELARDILCAAGGALAVTSANPSGARPALDTLEVANLGGCAPDMIVDGGRTPRSEPSTVILALSPSIRVVRAGAISAPEIAAVVADAGGRLDESGLISPHAV